MLLAPSPRRLLALLALALCLLTLCLLTTAAQAQSDVDEEQGRTLAGEAMGFYQSGSFDEALVKFNEARMVYPTGQVLRMTAYTLIALERWVEAARTIDEALAADLKPLSDEDREHAQGERQKALEHIAVAEVVSPVADAEVSIDGGVAESLPTKIYLEPGSHSFVVTAPGHAPIEREQELSAGQQTTVELEPTPLPEDAPPPPPPPKPKPKPPEEPSSSFGWFPGQGIVGLATAGAGAALVGVAIGTGIYGANLRTAVQNNIDAHYSSYDATCTQNRDSCLSDIALINSDGERAQSYQNAALVTGITGGSLLAVGTLLFLFSDDSPLAPQQEGAEKARVQCLPTGLGFGCAGSF
ncbi:MAG: PEGA domain-containing protein [Polyangiaceae bacterium]